MPYYHVIANRSAVESVKLVIEAESERLAEISAEGWLNSRDFDNNKPPAPIKEAYFKCYGDTESIWDDFEAIESVDLLPELKWETSRKGWSPWSPAQ
jgi:hypothetical protein